MNRQFVLLALLATTACAPMPRLGEVAPPRDVASLAAQQSLAGPAAAWPSDDWWKGLGDPALDALITEGLNGSPDVVAAAARVRAAEAFSQQARAAIGPSLAVDGSVGGTQQSQNLGPPPQFVPDGVLDTGRLTAVLSFNPDLWGKNRAALRAARGEAAAARVDAAQARLLLTTSIAAAYADLALYYIQRDVALDAVKVREQIAKLTADRVSVGLDNRGSMAQADTRLPQARADVLAIDEAMVLTRNRIAALLGAGPDRGLSIARPALKPVPLGIPSDASIELVGRRPDIVAVKLRAEAASARVKVARADFYPNVNLSVLAGVQSLGVGRLLTSNSGYGNGGLAISLPVFDAGRVQGRYRGARADYDAAVARYDSTLVAALRDVADALATRNAADIRLAQLNAALVSAEEGSRIALLRYRGGLSNQLSVLATADGLLAVRRAAADLDARRTALDIILIRALGGGYRSTPIDAGAK